LTVVSILMHIDAMSLHQLVKLSCVKHVQ